MSLLNRMTGAVVDVLLYPLAGWPPLVGIAVISLLTAIGMLMVFRATSDQARLAQVKRRIHAGLFEIRLFNDDLRAVLRAQADILRANLIYLRLSAAPMLWMIVPLVLLIAQLQFRYGYEPLEPGRPALVKVQLRTGSEPQAVPERARGVGPGVSLVTADAGPPVALHASAGVRIEAGPLWIPSLRETTWRIVAETPGEHRLVVMAGEELVTKTVRADGGLPAVSPVRLERGFFNQVLYPAEPPLPSGGPVASITVMYPERALHVLGLGVHWLIVFFVLSIVFAFALRKRFGVVI
jgi:uncharacterized membrane protein (DUF106 family)